MCINLIWFNDTHPALTGLNPSPSHKCSKDFYWWSVLDPKPRRVTNLLRDWNIYGMVNHDVTWQQEGVGLCHSGGMIQNKRTGDKRCLYVRRSVVLCCWSLYRKGLITLFCSVLYKKVPVKALHSSQGHPLFELWGELIVESSQKEIETRLGCQSEVAYMLHKSIYHCYI